MTGNAKGGAITEDTVPEGEALFDSLFEDGAVGVATFSIGGRFLRANPAFCRMVGYSEPELQLKNHLDIIHLDDLEAAAVSRVQAIAGKTKPRVVGRRYLKSPTFRPTFSRSEAWSRPSTASPST